jgi:hypothetical protein
MNPAQARCALASLLVVSATLAACSDTSTSTAPAGVRQALAAAKSGTQTLTVTSTSPSYGNPGQVNEVDTIIGSGFQAGAQVAYLNLDNSVDTTIAVSSTQFISSSLLVSTISISPNSPVAFRNVRVTNSSRTQGIGNSAFEVTQANPIVGAGDLRGVNDNGEITGNGGPIYWSTSTGILAVDNIGAAGFAISPMGNAISANHYPALYTRAGAVGTPWARTNLPVGAAATDGGAQTLVADPTTGQVVLVGGREFIPTKKNSGYYLPDLWTWQSGSNTWLRVNVSTGSSNQGSVRKISQSGVAVGWLGPGADFPGTQSQAAVWTPDGSGGWTLTTIAPVPSGAEGINGAGTIVVGQAGGVAVYWQLVGSSWTGPITLPGGCVDARAVDNSGRIAVNGCASSNPEPAAVLLPPYSAANMVYLGGLGRGNTATIESMSPSGSWIVGVAGSGSGVYWRPF